MVQRSMSTLPWLLEGGGTIGVKILISMVMRGVGGNNCLGVRSPGGGGGERRELVIGAKTVTR
jgi:hypothetical protein